MDARADDSKFAILSEGRSDRRYLLLLLLLVLPLRAWLLYNTEVTARDGIGYIRYALGFDEAGFGEVIRAHHQHPGYPIGIWAVSTPLRALHGGTDAEVMRIAAQTVSAIAALLLLVPMYFLGKELLGRRIAFWGTLLFQYLPVSGQHLSDAVSEPTFLLMTTTALWLALAAFRLAGEARSLRLHILSLDAEGNNVPKSSALRCHLLFVLSGLFGGLAYWTRPEGAFIVASAGIVLIGRQFLVTRTHWRDFLTQGFALAAPAMMLAGAFYLVTGQWTVKISPRIVVGSETLSRSMDSPPAFTQPEGALFASAFGSFIPQAKDYPTRFQRAGRTFVSELVQGFHYLGCIGVVLGLMWYGGSMFRMPGFWVLLIYALIQTATLFMLAVRAFYISDRHVMVLVLPSCFFMAAGLLESGRRLQVQLRRTRVGAKAMGWSLSVLAAAGMVLLCLPKTAQSLHGNRQGNHLAGLWLKDRLKNGDLVVDDHCWSHYYAGQMFLEGREPAVSRDYQPVAYVVMTRSKIREVDAIRKDEESQLLEAKARIVYHWPPSAEPERARVVVFALPRDFQKYPWKVAESQ